MNSIPYIDQSHANRTQTFTFRLKSSVRGYINNPEVYDETKEAMLEYLRTGEVQPCTGAGLNPVDKFIAQNVTKVSIGLALSIVPLAVLPFL